MTVKELIEKLNKISDKSIQVQFEFKERYNNFGNPADPDVCSIGNICIISNNPFTIICRDIGESILKDIDENPEKWKVFKR